MVKILPSKYDTALFWWNFIFSVLFAVFPNKLSCRWKNHLHFWVWETLFHYFHYWWDYMFMDTMELNVVYSYKQTEKIHFILLKTNYLEIIRIWITCWCTRNSLGMHLAESIFNHYNWTGAAEIFCKTCKLKMYYRSPCLGKQCWCNGFWGIWVVNRTSDTTASQCQSIGYSEVLKCSLSITASAQR